MSSVKNQEELRMMKWKAGTKHLLAVIDQRFVSQPSHVLWPCTCMLHKQVRGWSLRWRRILAKERKGVATVRNSASVIVTSNVQALSPGVSTRFARGPRDICVGTTGRIADIHPCVGMHHGRTGPSKPEAVRRIVVVSCAVSQYLTERIVFCSAARSVQASAADFAKRSGLRVRHD